MNEDSDHLVNQALSKLKVEYEQENEKWAALFRDDATKQKILEAFKINPQAVTKVIKELIEPRKK